MEVLPKVVLKSGKEQSLFRLHPWVFSGAIKHIEGNVAEGQAVKVVDNKGSFLATGHYQIGSIAVRIISFKDIEINYSFWKNKISQAYELRKRLGFIDNPDLNVFRLVNAEGDEMPGLIIDIYNEIAVTQFHSIGMYLAKEEIIKALIEVVGDAIKGIYDKSEGTMPFKAAVKAKNGWLTQVPVFSPAPYPGNTGEGVSLVTEYGNKFLVDYIESQKTGFFIDQRENRKLLNSYASGRTVLNMFCYTGAFSVYAISGGAKLVHSVDSSAKAIEMTHKNISLNFPDTINHESYTEDAFAFLNNMDDKYDLIVLDPPAFAKHNEALNNALQGYKKLNQKALEKIKKGGLLFTFSCSQVVTKENFRKSVFAASVNAKRKVSILHQLTQPPDHPVSIYHPEGEYLKGLVCYVE
jgi:23S rRNA (cytosine1962-C5)-methyltransferase